jgi:heme-degrading monooxygenase HmoA
MAVMMILDWHGVTTDDYDRVNEAMGIGSDADAPEGLINHVAALDEDGELAVVDVWESEEALGRFVESRLGPTIKQLGLPEEKPRVLPVHHRLRGGADDGNVVMMIHVENGSTDTYDAMTADMPEHAGDGSAHPSHSHTAAVDGDALVIVDEWPSIEAFQQFMEQRVGPAGAKHGMSPESVKVRPLRLHNRIRGRARAGA